MTGTGARHPDWDRQEVVTPETTRTAQMGKVFGFLKGLHATYLVDLGTRLGLFAHLAAAPGGLTPEALAEQAHLHPDYARLWCETACALELLDYHPQRGYRLAPFMDELLGAPAATFYVGLFPPLHLLLARDYQRYPELMRSGGVYPYHAHDESFLRAVAEGTQTLPRMFLDAVLPRLPALLARLEAAGESSGESSGELGAAILDVGCGGGHALVAFAERFPQVRCTGVDLEPTSIRLAQDLIRARGLESRIQALLLEHGEWPAALRGAFDLVTQFLVLHEIRPDLKPAVLARCAAALRPGGRLLLFDERYPSGPAELRDPSQIYAVMAQWYEMTWGNVINTREEIRALLDGCGLRVVEETALSRFYIVVAEKAEAAAKAEKGETSR